MVKKSTLLLVVLLLLPSISQSKTSWTRINGIESNKNWVMAMDAVSPTAIWIVGSVDNGSSTEIKAYKSTNGSSFSEIYLPSGSGGMTIFSSIKFMDENVGFLSGLDIELPFKDGFDLDTNIVWRTTNGGSSWDVFDDTLEEMISQMQIFPSGQLFAVSETSFYTMGTAKMNVGGAIPVGDLTINSLHMLTTSIGYVAGGEPADDENPGKILHAGFVFKTTDGGATWVALKEGINFSIKSIQFINEDQGWIAGDDGTKGYVMITTDGGATWTNQTLPLHPELEVEINFPFKATQTIEPTPVNSVVSLQFFDCSRGVLLGSACTGNCDTPEDASYLTMFLRTYDGGITWEMDPDYEPAMGEWGEMNMVPKILSGASAMVFLSPNQGFIGGQNLMVLSYNADTPEEEPSATIPDCSGGSTNTNNSTNNYNNDPGFTDTGSSDSGCGCSHHKGNSSPLWILIGGIFLLMIRRRK
jgi:photosystem II stability/assembly factor-like uncharacterized protein